LAYVFVILFKQRKFIPCAGWAPFYPVLSFGLFLTLQLNLGVILFLGLFTNILKFTIMKKKSILNQVLLEDQPTPNYGLIKVVWYQRIGLNFCGHFA